MMSPAPSPGLGNVLVGVLFNLAAAARTFIGPSICFLYAFTAAMNAFLVKLSIAQ